MESGLDLCEEMGDSIRARSDSFIFTNLPWLFCHLSRWILSREGETICSRSSISSLSNPLLSILQSTNSILVAPSNEIVLLALLNDEFTHRQSILPGVTVRFSRSNCQRAVFVDESEGCFFSGFLSSFPFPLSFSICDSQALHDVFHSLR